MTRSPPVPVEMAVLTKLDPHTTGISMTDAAPEQASACAASHLLPAELIQEILSYLNPLDFESARLVSRAWFNASLCKLFLLRLIDEVCRPGHTSCRRTNALSPYICSSNCPCKPLPNPGDKDDLRKVRHAFAKGVERWPGSRVRVSCGKTVLDMTPFLSNQAHGKKWLGTPREFEFMDFSEPSGSFVGTIVRTVESDGRVERKLFVHRLFSFRHSTLGDSPRILNGSACKGEMARCSPGRMYMIIDLVGNRDLPVVGVRIEEHPALSTIRKAEVTYVNGGKETTTYKKFKPVKQEPANHLGSGNTLFYDRSGVTYRTPPYPNTQTPTPKKTRSRFSCWPRIAEKDSVIYVSPVATPPKNIKSASQHVLARTSKNGPLQQCHRLSIPTSSGEGHFTIILTSKNEILVCRSTPTSPNNDSEMLQAKYNLLPPLRLSQGPAPRLTHLTVAPQHFFDFGNGFWRMAIVAAYENGEIIIWRLDTETLEESSVSSVTTPVISVPEKTLSSFRNGETQWQSSKPSPEPPTPRKTQGSETQTLPVKGTFDPKTGACISINLETFQKSVHQAPIQLCVALPSETTGPLHPTPRACKLAYLPDIQTVRLVGKGQTLLVGTRAQVVIFDMRISAGFEGNWMRECYI